MSRSARGYLGVALAAFLAMTGCASPYRSDQGALVGGVTGAGVGALVGDAVHHPLAGAAIGAGVGALSGAVVGNSIDQADARNRAEIAARTARAMPPVTVQDVVAMTRAGVPEGNIITNIQTNGVAAPVQSGDLIMLQQQGVSPNVVHAMQARGAAPPIAGPAVYQPAPIYMTPYAPVYAPPPAYGIYPGGFGARW